MNKDCHGIILKFMKILCTEHKNNFESIQVRSPTRESFTVNIYCNHTVIVHFIVTFAEEGYSSVQGLRAQGRWPDVGRAGQGRRADRCTVNHLPFSRVWGTNL